MKNMTLGVTLQSRIWGGEVTSGLTLGFQCHNGGSLTRVNCHGNLCCKPNLLGQVVFEITSTSIKTSAVSLTRY